MTLAVALLALACLLVTAPSSWAVGFYPTRTDDPEPNGCAPSDCSLREAVIAANANSGFDFVQLGSGVYQLTRGTPAGQADAATDGDLDITDTSDTFVLGQGTPDTIIDGGDVDRIFDIATNARLTVYSVEIRKGNAKQGVAGHWHGGGIHNHGYLGLFWSVLTSNTVPGSAPGSSLPWGGGGLTNAGTGTAELSDVTIARNTTGTCGGGIENGGTLKAWNLTIAENTAAAGGGVANGLALPTCFPFAGATARLNNTIIAGNSPQNCQGAITSAGHNAATDASCTLTAAGDLPPTASLLLAPVFDPAGYVWLYTPQSGSAVIDAGGGPFNAATQTGCSSIDQVGTRRPQDGDNNGTPVCDIGATEVEAAPTPPGPTCNGQTATIVGTNGDDELDGTSGRDVIVGLDGEDEIRGRDGNDLICSGADDDDVGGGDGDDEIHAEQGDDEVTGGNGDDEIHGGLGEDDLSGGRGRDRVFGEEHDDELRGGRGNDDLDGGPGRDECSGGPGSDTELQCES